MKSVNIVAHFMFRILFSFCVVALSYAKARLSYSRRRLSVLPSVRLSVCLSQAANCTRQMIVRHSFYRSPRDSRFWYQLSCPGLRTTLARASNETGLEWVKLKTVKKWLYIPLDIPRTTTSLGDRAFAVAGPRVWNSLPPAIRDPSLSPSIFGKLLKTYLFV